MNSNPQISINSGPPLPPGEEVFFPRRVPSITFKFTPASELIADMRPPKWLVKDYLEAGTVTCLIGPSESYKTFLALDIGLCVAAGKDWHGRPVTQGPVFYICGEGKAGIGRRIDAWCRENNIARENLPFFVSETAAQLTDTMGMAIVMAGVVEVMMKYGKPALIIIDTLNRNFGDGDENSTRDMTRFISAIDQLRNNFKCAVQLVHHTGVSNTDRGRGSSALRGAIDFEYLITRNGNLITMKATKVKDFDSPPSLSFKPVTVDLGLRDDEDRPISSIALELTATTPAGSKKKADKMPRGATKIALDALLAVLDESGRATDEEWRLEAYAKGVSKSQNPDARQKAFIRAKSDLLETGLIGAEGDFFYLVPNDTGQTGQ